MPDRYVEYGTRILFGVWFAKADFLTAKSQVYAEVLRRLAAAGIHPAVPRQELGGPEGAVVVTMQDGQDQTDRMTAATTMPTKS